MLAKAAPFVEFPVSALSTAAPPRWSAGAGRIDEAEALLRHAARLLRGKGSAVTRPAARGSLVCSRGRSRVGRSTAGAARRVVRDGTGDPSRNRSAGGALGGRLPGREGPGGPGPKHVAGSLAPVRRDRGPARDDPRQLVEARVLGALGETAQRCRSWNQSARGSSRSPARRKPRWCPSISGSARRVRKGRRDRESHGGFRAAFRTRLR